MSRHTDSIDHLMDTIDNSLLQLDRFPEAIRPDMERELKKAREQLVLAKRHLNKAQNILEGKP